nr:hypothetical protein CFP56_02124 [Quercus suber]
MGNGRVADGCGGGGMADGLPFSNFAAQAINSEDEEDDVVTETNDSTVQAVDSKDEEEEDVVTKTNSNSKLQSDSFFMYMNEQVLPLDSSLEHEITKSEAPILVPLPLNSASSFSVPLLMPPLAAVVDFVSKRTYYKSKRDLACTALKQVNQQFNAVNNTQFQPPIANANGITSYYNFADEFVPLSLNSAVTGVVSSPLPMAPPHSHAVDFNTERAYYKSKLDISCPAAN